ncbi:BatA domain-containing protein [Stenotrophomonas lacuserhaii]|uniref:BatA domain-containing protein n=1 Tax=Stenotrophomonas lacuserhaii TaxID=2760084 RepID=UPI0038779E45
MSLSLLFPLGLLALVSLLVPLLMHLARRQHEVPLDFAALRWLQARVRPRSRVRIDEWLLLVLRLLLLAALALLLAQPVLQGGTADVRPVTVVAPGLDGAALRGADNQGDWRWLAPGFPPLQQSPAASTAAFASLLRELDQTLPAGTPLVVHLPDPLPGLDGERIRLSRSVQWRPQPLPLTAAGTVPEAPRLHAGGNGDPAALRVLDALQRAWTGSPLAVATDDVPADGRIGVWLAAAPLPPAWQAWVAEGGSVLRVATPQPGSADTGTATSPWLPVLRDAQGALLLEQRRVGRGRLLRFPAALSTAAFPAVAEDDFPRHLRDVLMPPAVPALGMAADQVPLTGAPAPLPRPRDLAPWMLLAIVLLFALERWLATSARRRSTP